MNGTFAWLLFCKRLDDPLNCSKCAEIEQFVNITHVNIQMMKPGSFNICYVNRLLMS